MAKQIRDARVLLKRVDTPGLIPELGPGNDHTLGWAIEDIYRGELFLNMADNKMWVITGKDSNFQPHEIPMYDGNDLNLKGNIKIDGLPQAVGPNVLYYDNVSGNVTYESIGTIVVNLGGETGTETFTVTNSSGTDATIPAASTSNAGLVTTGTQSFTGEKSFFTNTRFTTLSFGGVTYKVTLSYSGNQNRTLTVPLLADDRTFSFVNQDETISGNRRFTGVSSFNEILFGAGGLNSLKATLTYPFTTARTLTVPDVGGNRTFSFIDENENIDSIKTFTEGLILGNSTLTTNGSLRFDGANFQGRRDGTWETFLTSGNVVTTDTTQTITGEKTFTNNIRGSNGTEGEPTYSFTNATSTGMFRPVANAIGLSAGGTERIRITSLIRLGTENVSFLGGETVYVTNSSTNTTGSGGGFLAVHNTTPNVSANISSGIKFRIGSGTSINYKAKGAIFFSRPAAASNGRGDFVFALNDTADWTSEALLADRKMVLQNDGKLVLSSAITDNNSSGELISVIKNQFSTTGADGSFIKLHNNYSTESTNSVFTGLKFQFGSMGTANRKPKGAIFYKKSFTSIVDGRGEFVFSLNNIPDLTTEALYNDRKFVINNDGDLDTYGDTFTFSNTVGTKTISSSSTDLNINPGSANVGISRTSPTEKLDVNGTVKHNGMYTIQGTVTSTTTQTIFSISNNQTYLLIINSTGTNSGFHGIYIISRTGNSVTFSSTIVSAASITVSFSGSSVQVNWGGGPPFSDYDWRAVRIF